MKDAYPTVDVIFTLTKGDSQKILHGPRTMS